MIMTSAQLEKRPPKNVNEDTNDFERLVERFAGMSLEIAGERGSEILGRLVRTEDARIPPTKPGDPPNLCTPLSKER